MAAHPYREGFALLKNRNVGRMFVASLVSYTGSAMAPTGIGDWERFPALGLLAAALYYGLSALVPWPGTGPAS